MARIREAHIDENGMVHVRKRAGGFLSSALALVLIGAGILAFDVLYGERAAATAATQLSVTASN